MLHRQSTVFKFRNSQKVIIVVNIMLTIALVYMYVKTISNVNVNEDGGFYLANMERIVEGFIPIKELHIGYPPVIFYLFALVKMIFDGNAPYEAYISVILILQILSGYILFRIISPILNNKGLSFFFSLVMLFSMYYYQGHGIFLEPLVVLFSLWALHITCIPKTKMVYFFFSGILMGLGLLSKQYGLAIGLPLAVSAYFKYREKIYKIVGSWSLLFLGFILTFSLCYVLFYIYYDVSVSQFCLELFDHTSYGNQSVLATFMGLLKYIVNGAPFLLLLPLLGFFKPSSKTLLATSVVGFVSFLMPTYFAQYGHYYILVIPFSMIIASQLITCSVRNAKVKQFMVIFTLLALLYIPARAFKAHLWIDSHNNRKEQVMVAKAINKYLPQKSEVFVVANPAYLYLCNFYPNHSKKWSYGYIDNYTYEFIKTMIAKSPYALTSTKEISWMNKKIGVNLNNELQFKFKFKRIAQIQDMTLWERPKNKND